MQLEVVVGGCLRSRPSCVVAKIARGYIDSDFASSTVNHTCDGAKEGMGVNVPNSMVALRRKDCNSLAVPRAAEIPKREVATVS